MSTTEQRMERFAETLIKRPTWREGGLAWYRGSNKGAVIELFESLDGPAEGLRERLSRCSDEGLESVASLALDRLAEIVREHARQTRPAVRCD